ncbi:maltooligosyltrehalose trehalohydrolase [Microbacteriaceae bacterium SG_E_30_P1]|uniref:Malto-oligosyltrehalose trehalohydrolase n=1 Tax=Antiquaquibacter oligotrophicus TaxID=2880260 RepID=A0ABT6KQK2_9MICO|nr:malto-oligosyltrehalose trehalohydrolase [Antiquaquibacter oligotrophicus]MDH6182119.1 maltooligosyltrehalose trehalohydrolase [Antiquaquibacter oligotrophicus]UDF12218.1 malto-oligosyltrehalose trehalohydrolase [Antiquaquibacter oligotrophicus]
MSERDFTVWAPNAESMQLVLGGERVPMRRRDDSWWEPERETAWQAGLDYGYIVDGAETPLPDPRSLRQPNGVHGLSRTVDLADYSWQDAAWAGRELRGGIIYELHIGTFTPEGTLDSAIERLDHLVDLGVTFVEVLPVNSFNGTHNWGYDGVLWFAVQETYGGPAAYQRFVDACHARGLAVVQDVVYNHLGPSGNYLPNFGPYLGSGANTWGDTVNLDGEGSAEVRKYILDNALQWLRDFHVDALRLDAVHAFVDTGEPHLLADLSAATDALALELGRPITLIAESDLNDPIMVTPRGLGGYGITAQWDDDYHHAAHVAVTGETFGYYEDFASLGALAKVLRGGFFHDGTYSSFREREHGAPIDTAAVPSWRLVTFTQDHDQIGNRAAGDRPSQYLDEASLRLEAVLALMTPFTPMLFMGQEWGASTPWQFFTSHPEPELGRATAEGRLAEFSKMGWDPATVPDPQDPETFTRSKLNWSERDAPAHARLLDLYRDLARLRHAHTELSDPAFLSRVEVDEDAGWLWFERGQLAVAVNVASEERELPLVAAEVLLATGNVSAGASLALAPRSAAVITRTPRP